jgi:hypothetical protein
MRALLAFLIALSFVCVPAAAAGKYRNFRTAIYVTVTSTKELADPKVFAKQFERMQRQVKFDKVYIEAYRDHLFATDAELSTVREEFVARGIAVAGGITLAAGGSGGQFGTFDYENEADRAECKKAVELIAHHFNEVILDDFFFYSSKSDADITAKGDKSWTQYRLERMREVAKDLVVGPAKAVNPSVRVIIKYPNWYEHFQGLGFDLDEEPHIFDGIYTGTETRDPIVTDQLLQQYESYGIIRYFDNIKPGGNGGGWVDTYGTRYTDRYAEQLWDTLFAKAPEITLFNWRDLSTETTLTPGDRPWLTRPTSFNWPAMVKRYGPVAKGEPGPGWASAAGYSLEQVDSVLGSLGKPIGITSYKPYQSDGDDFLQHYLGNVGLPIEMTPNFPDDTRLVLLTEEAKADPDIVKKIDRHLRAGGDVVITSGFLRAMQQKGFRNIAEWETTGRVMGLHNYIGAFGAGPGTMLNDPGRASPDVLFPEVRFYTNDSWPVIRGVAGAKGDPILLMNHYSKGVIWLLNIPDNQSDLYNLPQGVLTEIKKYLLKDFPVRIDSPDLVAMFAYDNGTFVAESYRHTGATAKIIIPGENVHVRDLATGKLLVAAPPEKPATGPFARRYQEPPKTVFPITLEPHSYRAYRIEH